MSYSLVGYGRFGEEPSPQNDVQAPPPCDDPAKVKAMLIKAGYEIPEPEPGWKDASGQPSGDKLAIGFTLLQFVADQGMDPNTATPQEVCDALVKASGGPNGEIAPTNGSGEGLSTEAKVAIGVGAVVVVGAVAYFALK